MAYNDKFYIFPEDLYRFGNSSSPLIDRLRPLEVDLFDQNGVEMIMANGAGISLYNKMGLEKSPLSGWVWEVREGEMLPQGLVIIDDGSTNNPGHFTLAPQYTMPFAKYIGLLSELAVKCQKVFKKDKAG